MKSKLTILSVLLLLWNPITLSILLKSIGWGVLISLTVVIIGLLISKCKSLRLKVWTFNIAAILSVAYHAELLFIQFGGDKNIPNLYEIHDNFYFNKPYLEQQFDDDEYTALYRTNCQGYRIDKLTNADDSIKACDWLFIGDSFTQGGQVDYDQLFTTLVYKRFPNKVVVNAGISGAGVYEELNYYKNMGRKLRPKKVFLQLGVFNDFKDVVEHKATLKDYLNEKSALYRFFSYHIGQSDELPLGRWMEPFFVNHQDNVDGNILYKPTSENKELDKQRMRNAIAEFKKLVEQDGGELVLILLPSKEQVSPAMLKATLKACNLNESDLDLMAASRLCEEIAETNNLKLIDLYEDFKIAPFPFFEVDEHLNIIGHEVIAERIVTEYAKDADEYEYYSGGNRNERYPSLLTDSVSVLYQSQEIDCHLICVSTNGGFKKVLWSSSKELIHPSISEMAESLIFTTGNQDKQETEVVLYNFSSDEQITLNEVGSSASIPMFSADGTQVVFPQWKFDDPNIKIAVYDIAARKIICQISDGVECWRPIFSNSGDVIYYICREKAGDKFTIKSYLLADKSKTTILKTVYDIWDIALSPSGRYMAYAGNKDGNWDLFLLDLESKQTRQLTHTLGDEWDPAFGVSDSDLWFAGVFGFNNGIYHITIKQ